MSRAFRLAAAGALLCLVAALFAVPAFYVPGLAALLLACVAPAWVLLSLRGASVTLGTQAASVQEGERLRVTIAVARGAIPFPDATLTPWPGAEPIRPAGGRRGEIAASAVIARRGRRALGPARLRVSDPFGICVRELRSQRPELLVLPRVYPIHALALAGREGERRTPLAGALELDSLRPYQPGGPATRIHWPTVARTGALMERAFTAEADPRALVILDASGAESEEALDQAVRAAASLCVHLARRGGCLLLLPGERRPLAVEREPRSWQALHTRLALVEAAAEPPGLPLVQPRLVLYVTARQAARPAVRGACYRVAPRPLAGLAGAFTVAGCTGQLLDGARVRRFARSA
ncbi:MAG TPA: DUF58 domain-containing protein [Solirubrobacteraceae bacterium]|jgi:uncharacterized protein (DUF58 family)|nr:DUF58 domain-containing protein [Solirubrobacteraceae bacterium]